MNPQDIQNMGQWLQQIMKDLSDTRTQLIDMRGENKAANDEIKGVSGRMDQKDSDILRLLDSMRAQIDIMRGEVSGTKSTLEGRMSSIENQIKDLKSAVHEVRNKVH